MFRACHRARLRVSTQRVAAASLAFTTFSTDLGTQYDLELVFHSNIIQIISYHFNSYHVSNVNYTVEGSLVPN